MPSDSALTASFRTERPGPDTVRLVIKTLPGKNGDWVLFAGLAGGLYLTAVLGSYNDDIRAAAQPVLIAILGFAVLVGLALKLVVAWAAHKTSGTVSFYSPTRTLSQQGLQALFPWGERALPHDAVIVLDAVSVLHASSRNSLHRQSVYVRLWCVPADGRSPDEMAQFVEAHRDTLPQETFRSLDAAPLPEGAIPLGTALENPIFRRLAEMLVESGACTAYDATGAQTGTLEKPAFRTVTIAAPTRYVIPTTSLPIRILFTVMATVVAAFIALVSLNPYIFVYVLGLTVMAVSTRQVLVCDASGLHLHFSYFMGLWQRGHDDRRWNEITAIQIEKVSNGFMALAVRRADGNDWKIILPNERVGRRIEQEINGFMGQVPV